MESGDMGFQTLYNFFYCLYKHGPRGKPERSIAAMSRFPVLSVASRLSNAIRFGLKFEGSDETMSMEEKEELLASVAIYLHDKGSFMYYRQVSERVDGSTSFS